MNALLLLALLCLSLTGFVCTALWSRAEPAHPRRWDAAFAFVTGLAAAELVLLASPLGMLLPTIATLGLVLPILAGPFFWRSRDSRLRWSWRRWLLQCVPGIALLVSGVITVAGSDASAWTAGDLPAVALVIAAALVNLAAGALRWPRRRSTARRWILR